MRVRVYDLQGRVRDDRSAGDINVTSGGAVQVLALPRLARDSSVLFVRAQLLDKTGKVVSENVYWQSQQLDDVGDPSNDSAFELKQSELGRHDRAQLHDTSAAGRDRVQNG